MPIEKGKNISDFVLISATMKKPIFTTRAKIFCMAFFHGQNCIFKHEKVIIEFFYQVQKWILVYFSLWEWVS